VLSEVNQEGRTLKHVALRASDGAWVVLFDDSRWEASADVPQDCQNELVRLTSESAVLKSVALGPNNTWVILYGTNGVTVSTGVPATLTQRLINLQNQAQTLKSVALAPNGGWAVFYAQNGFTVENASGLFQQLRLLNANVVLKSVTFGPNSSWAFLVNTNGAFYSSDVPGIFQSEITAIQNISNTPAINTVALGPSVNYAVGYSKNAFRTNVTRAVRTIRGASRR
jgi:hypothetical protein